MAGQPYFTAAIPLVICYYPSKNVSVASVFSSILLNISFRRGLVGNNLTLWFRLVTKVGA
jgi:hypothetical protein